MKRADTTLMKEINLNTVRRTLKRIGTASKPQLSKETGLSVVTVAALVRELAERGELTEEEAGPSTGGRPATLYRFNYRHSLALVMHLYERESLDTVFASVVDLRGEEVAREDQPFDELDCPSWLDWIGRLLTVYPNIGIVGLGIPGQAVDGEIEVSSHKRLIGLNPAALIGERFGLPVLLENDVNAALQGYLADETPPRHSEERIVLGLYFPDKYPPGLAISIGGRTIRGRKGMAGEIKYLPLGIDWNSPLVGDVFEETVCRLAHTVCAVLAPDRIVLYGERLNSSPWRGAWQDFIRHYPLPAEPEVEGSGQFAEHFALGLRKLALQALEPKLSYGQTSVEPI